MGWGDGVQGADFEGEESRKEKELFARLVKFDREDTSVVFEVSIGREDGPVSSQSDSANQGVDNRYGNAFACTVIARPSGSLVVRGFSSHVRKRAKKRTKPFKLGWSSNA